MGSRKTCLCPQYFYTDRSKAVLLLWFLTVNCSCCPYLYFGSAIMLVTYFVNFRELNDHLFGKELFIRFSASAFRKLPSVYVFSYFPFGFEGRMWDLIVSVPDHCFSFYLLPWLFTLVQRNYARWLPVHIREMASVHETHPDNYVQPSCKPKKCKRLSRKM